MIKNILSGVLLLYFIFLAQPAEAAFNKMLFRGSSGKDVSELQRLLSTLPDIYPERSVSGFFGEKTVKAIRRFQKKYGIAETGTVGFKTRAKLNELLQAKSPQAVIKPSSSKSLSVSTPKSVNKLSQLWSGGKCDGKGAVTFTSPPMKMEDVSFILPMGLMSGSHVTPVDHLYFHTSHKNTGRYDVLAPADGYVVSAEIVGDSKDYRMVLEHTCTLYTIYIHVTELAPKILAQTGLFSRGSKMIRVPVRAGEIIGTKIPNMEAKTFQVDFSVANAEFNLKGFVVPEHYTGELWKVHTDDLYKYYKDSLKGELIAKTVRTAEPVSGKIDYDTDGRLVGNWFRAGTNGYSGSNPYQYWEGHLTIAYDYIDPTKVRISIGDWGGKSMQAAVAGNIPDPKDVGVETGLVKYELIDSHYIHSSGGFWDQETLAKNIQLDISKPYPYGTLLAQLVDQRKLKLETFPGKSAAEVSGFTANALMYER
ncbi:MAG: peptidoglycan-binding protein [bacterium]|nr:peptidoglycan-binding protein [bacterium]